MPQTRTESPFRMGLADGLPIALGYLSVSFSFGLMVVNGGESWITAVLISLTNLTSAGQLAGLEIMLAGGPLIELVIAELIINARYALMSISLTQKLHTSFTSRHRLLCAFGMTDEIFAVASSRDAPIVPAYFYGLMTLPIVGWTAGTFFGAAAGGILPDGIKNALGIALYGMFLAIILPSATKNRAVAFCVLIAACLSCVIAFTPLFNFISSGFSVVICAVAAAAFAAWRFPIREAQDEEATA